MAKLNVTVVHRLPGRIRLQLNRPPMNVEKLLRRVIRHEGIKRLSFNPISKCIIAEFTPSLISSTEIILRISIALSVEFNGSSVKLDVKKKTIPLTVLDYYSGSSILLAALTKMLGLPLATQQYFNYNAGLSTTASVMKHAFYEVKHEGIYDPEVVSVVYLINSLINGNFLVASGITWIATFGRHLLADSEESCLLKAIEVEGDQEKSYMDVEVHQVMENKDSMFPVKMMVQGLSKTIGLKPIDNSRLIDSIRRVSKAHHDVLEGIGKQPNPIYMRVEY
jgi:hypothetical protein